MLHNISQVGCGLSVHRQVVARQLGAAHAVLRLPARNQARDLYHQRDRVAEHEPAQGHQEPGRVTKRRGTAKTVLSRHAKHQQKMDDADKRLEGCAKSVYYPVRGSDATALRNSVYTKF